MRFSLRELVNILFGRQSGAVSQTTCLSSNPNEKLQETPVTSASLSDSQLQSILNYWLDFELFDIPECPYASVKNKESEPASQFDEQWLNAEKPLPKIKKDSKLFVMFQCHRAGYLFAQYEGKDGKPLHPNTVTPTTYLLGVAFIPTLNTDPSTGTKYLTWQLSEEDQDKVVNLATIRTIYRRCRSAVSENMALMDWVESCIESIEHLLITQLSGVRVSDTETVEPFTTLQLKKAIIEVNRSIARTFWPTRDSREFMERHAKDVNVDQQDKFDEAGNPNKNRSDLEDIATFRWRFCYYLEGNEQNQLGPFFAEDLNYLAEEVSSSSARDALSPALYCYLQGNQRQITLRSAREDSDKYHAMTRGFFKGRWPDNPNHGLSLLQSCAVNLVSKRDDNPVVAVNGPPGTGKTTLLKDVIAERFVSRTIQMLKYESADGAWLGSEEVLEAILDASIVVASSNNKAVENISKELPALAKIHEPYRTEIGYFREQAQDDEWGLFCAVLGNGANRKAFCDNRLNKLLEYFNSLSDYLGLSSLVYQLNKNERDKAERMLVDYFLQLQTVGKISSFVQEIDSCEIYLKAHMEFLRPFSINLRKVATNEIPLEEFIYKWCQLDDVRWKNSLNALKKLSQVWWKAEIWKRELESEYQHSKEAFETLLSRHQDALEDINSGRFDHWGGEPGKHLIFTSAYKLQDEEDPRDAEARIQQLSPLGRPDLNQLRSQLFIAALRVSEAIIKLNAADLDEDLRLLPQLINGKYQSNENPPVHEKLWGLLFLLFPVVSTSLSSVESQFRLMQKKSTIGLVMLDEAGQAVNYHVVGLLQRCRQAIVVGDPIQLEPVVPVQGEIDRGIASDFIAVSNEDGQISWGDRFLVSESSAQLLADAAGPIKAVIGQREVGLPLLVHRRCTEPMFSIANSIAYDDKMVLATESYNWCSISSGWLNVIEDKTSIKRQGYRNNSEAEAAFELVRYLVEHQPDMTKGGIYLITPFTHMKNELKYCWKTLSKQPANKKWMEQATRLAGKDADIEDFANDCIGTVHTFQGKEASVVIFCLAASKIRNTSGGIKWVNSKPNLINVAVTRAKNHLFVVGNYEDWRYELCSSQLTRDGMTIYKSLDQLKTSPSLLLEEHLKRALTFTQVAEPSSDYSDVW